MKRAPLIVDTGAWLLALAGEEPYASALQAARPAFVPGLVLAEVDWHLRADRSSMRRLMADLHRAYAYEPPTRADLDRAMEIDTKFTTLRLGLVDASVASLAERLGVHRVLTTDSDFVAVRVGSRWDRALEIVVLPRKRRVRAIRRRRS
jgi:predicted nucleic acid-binding protein